MAEKKDKYGNPIPRFGQGWGKDEALKNRQGYNEDGTKGPWFSRSCAVCLMVSTKIDGHYCILANQRGVGAMDYKGYWNMPCGYLDYNETLEEAAARECFEETGIKISPNRVQFMFFDSDPKQNRQNVVFFYSVCLNSDDDIKLSTANMEENEVENLKWIPLADIDNYQWAFDHDSIIKRIFDYTQN